MVSASNPVSISAKGSIFSPIVDLLVLGGISTLCFALCQAADILSPMMEVSELSIQIIFYLSLVINQPHYSATYFRVYRSWPEVKRYAPVSIWMPLLLAALALSCFFSGQMAGWFCKIYFLTVSYHYAGQTYGIALIFAHKAGLKVDRFLKICFGLPIYSSAAVYLVGDEVITQRHFFLNVQLPMFHFPLWLYLLTLFFLVIGVGLYVVMSFRLASQNRKIPFIVHIVVLTQILWFTIGMRLELFTLLVPLFHCMQYLLITSYYRFQELTRAGRLPSMSHLGFFKSASFWKYYALLVIFGLVFFNGIPYMLETLKVSNGGFAYAIIYSFINLHHFLLDGEIWKLRKPEVGQALLS